MTSNPQRSSRILLTKKPVKNSYEALHFKKYDRTPSMETVLYYGFIPVKNFRTSLLDSCATRATSSIDSIFGNPIHDKRCFNPKEKATLIKLYKNGHFNNLPGATMLYQEKTYRVRNDRKTVNQRCGFDILGVSGSIAEALAIQASYAVLEEDGFDNLEIEINSVGDKSSREAFEKDISLYVRGIINKLPERTKELCKRNSYALFSSNEKEIEPLIEEAPKPINYLSEDSRTHLKEILEYMEELEMPYTINHRLIAHRALHGHTIFRITSAEESNQKNKNELISAYGMRYNPLSKRLGYQKSTPAVGVYLSYKKLNKKNNVENSLPPQICFVHIGSMAKQKSLKIINLLRQNRIPVYHFLTNNKLAGQMNNVEKLKMPYLIIMGHKEALEGTVMIRNTENHSQETIPVSDLLPYLKTINSGKKLSFKKKLKRN